MSNIFRQNWDTPGLYRDLVTCMTTIYKPSKDMLNEVVEEMNRQGYQFTYHGLKYILFSRFSSCSRLLHLPSDSLVFSRFTGQKCTLRFLHRLLPFKHSHAVSPLSALSTSPAHQPDTIQAPSEAYIHHVFFPNHP